jgi:predicted nucleic acid-binding protein
VGLSRVADTSFLLAFFDLDDARSEEAAERLEDPEPILVRPEVLAGFLGLTQEAHWVRTRLRRRGLRRSRWPGVRTRPGGRGRLG